MQQHNMRSVAQNFGSHSFLRSLVPTLRRHDLSRSCHRTAASDTAAAATQSEQQQQQQQQQHAPHVSVLLQEVLHNLNHMPIKVYVDCTLGAGGHMAAMIQQHPELEVCVGIDVDPVAHATAAAALAPLITQPGAPMLHQLNGNYSDVAGLLSGCAGGSLVGRVDAMLMDLGVSSMQLDVAERGFSFASDGPIDMRLGPSAGSSAEELVNAASEAQLGAIIRDYGEEKSWRAVARRIVAAREEAPIRTTHQLVRAIGQTQIRGSSSSSQGRRGGSRGIHPATRTFQALRIAVNDELGRLAAALPDALDCLGPGGRLAVISFHSLEDRIVKHALMRAAGRPTPDMETQTHGAEGWRVLDQLAAAAVGSIVTRKALTPTAAETAANPRSRSAKLRVFQKAGGPQETGSSDSSGSSTSSSSRQQRAEKKRARRSGAEPAAASV